MHLGIDLGTTNSLVALYHDDQVKLIPNALGHLLTPSVVSVQDDGQILVGLAARESLSTRPHATATAFKRWMGTDRQTKLAGKSFRAEELSALVLKSLKQDAEAFLGQAVDKALGMEPGLVSAHRRKIEAFTKAGRCADAKTALAAFEAIGPDAEVAAPAKKLVKGCKKK